MTMQKRMLAALAVLIMLMSCAFAQDAAPAQDTVLATVDGTPITYAEAVAAAQMLYENEKTDTETDYNSAVDYLVENAVIERKIAELGYDQFTENEMIAFRNDAAIEWEAALNDYVDYYLTEDTEQARAALREQAVAFYAGNGYSEEWLLEFMIQQACYDKLESSLMGDYAPSQEEIDAVFQEYGAQYQMMYEGNVPTYEYYTNYYGYESWYKPEGYRAVLHILLDVDEALLTACQDAQAAYEEASSAEAPDEAAVAAAGVAADETKAAVVASRQADLDAIYDRLAKGETFQALITEYNTDPGMQDAQMLASGYEVHPESIAYDTAFTAGAFSDNMQKIGDVSSPVVSQFGIHVLYYLADVPGGLIMTDSITQEIAEYLYATHFNDAYMQAMTAWQGEITITRDQETIDMLIAKAQEAAQQEDTVQPE